MITELFFSTVFLISTLRDVANCSESFFIQLIHDLSDLAFGNSFSAIFHSFKSLLNFLNHFSLRFHVFESLLLFFPAQSHFFRLLYFPRNFPNFFREVSS